MWVKLPLPCALRGLAIDDHHCGRAGAQIGLTGLEPRRENDPFCTLHLGQTIPNPRGWMMNGPLEPPVNENTKIIKSNQETKITIWTSSCKGSCEVQSWFFPKVHKFGSTGVLHGKECVEVRPQPATGMSLRGPPPAGQLSVDIPRWHGSTTRPVHGYLLLLSNDSF